MQKFAQKNNWLYFYSRKTKKVRFCFRNIRCML